MAIKPALNQFNGGEVSPWLEGRFDWEKYKYSAKLCKNFIPLIEGSLKRRSGTHFVAETESLPIITTKFVVTFSDSPTVLPDTYISVNGAGEEKINASNPMTYEINMDYGSVLTYSIRADGYQPVKGNLTVMEDNTVNIQLLSIQNAVTLTINTTPPSAEVYINGIKTRSLTFDKSQTVSYRATFGGQTKSSTIQITQDTTIKLVFDTIVFNSSQSQETFVTLGHGFYNVVVIGAGGGAGGGSYKDDRKSTGGGGGGGAGFHGVCELEGTYKVVVGFRGNGGGKGKKSGYEGENGGASKIGGIIIANGGYGGTRRYPENGDGGTGNQGAGGTIEVNITPVNVILKHDGFGGREKTATGGGSLYSGHGQGGQGVWMKEGQPGVNGYVYIQYLGETYNG